FDVVLCRVEVEWGTQKQAKTDNEEQGTFDKTWHNYRPNQSCLQRVNQFSGQRHSSAVAHPLLRNFKIDLPFIMLLARTSDLMFVDQAVVLNANALGNCKLVPFMTAECLSHECISVPIDEARRCGSREGS